MLIQIISIIAAIFGLLGAVINARGKRFGFYAYIVGNILWIIVGFHYLNFGLVIQFFLFLVIAIYGLITWKKKGIGK